MALKTSRVQFASNEKHADGYGFPVFCLSTCSVLRCMSRLQMVALTNATEKQRVLNSVQQGENSLHWPIRGCTPLYEDGRTRLRMLCEHDTSFKPLVALASMYDLRDSHLIS